MLENESYFPAELRSFESFLIPSPAIKEMLLHDLHELPQSFYVLY